MNTCTSQKRSKKESTCCRTIKWEKNYCLKPLRVTQFGVKALDDTETTPT